MSRGKWLGGVAMAMLFALTATPAAAGTTAELLKRLHEKGILTDEEYQQLAQQDAAQAAPAALPPAQVAAASLDDKRLVRMSDSGVGMEVGGVSVKISGSVNGFYTHENGQAPGPNTAVVGGVVPVGGKSASVR
ncbi:MAG: SHOCT domain-containing protein, partial [Sphingobium sp.]|nr:SHOCT domain-containing protein [Sphingobium sp.]